MQYAANAEMVRGGHFLEKEGRTLEHNHSVRILVRYETPNISTCYSLVVRIVRGAHLS
jgi:hypothetical protein